MADGVEAYISFLARGDTVKVVAQDEASAQLLFEGRICSVPARLLRLDGIEPYEAWEGYAQSKAVVFADYRMADAGIGLALNTVVQVLEDLGNCYYIEWEDGRGFAPYDAIGTAPVVYSGGGGGGGDSGGGDWTAPVL